jgi:hypothetical protein
VKNAETLPKALIFKIYEVFYHIMAKKNEKKEDIEIRFILREDKNPKAYADFIEARDYFKIKDNELAKMLLIKGIEVWFQEKLKNSD